MEDIVKMVASQYGLAGLLALALGLLAYKIGTRVVAAVDRLTVRSDENAKGLAERHDANTLAMSNAFAIAAKEIAESITASHDKTSQRVGEMSERIARIEATLDLPDTTPIRLPRPPRGG